MYVLVTQLTVFASNFAGTGVRLPYTQITWVKTISKQSFGWVWFPAHFLQSEQACEGLHGQACFCAPAAAVFCDRHALRGTLCLSFLDAAVPCGRPCARASAARLSAELLRHRPLCCELIALTKQCFWEPRNFKIMMLRHFRLSGFVARGVRFKIS